MGIYEDIFAKQVSEEIRITTFDLMMVDKFAKLPRDKLLTFTNVKKNTYRGVASLLTTEDTKIRVAKPNPEPKALEKEGERPKDRAPAEKDTPQPKITPIPESKTQPQPKVKDDAQDTVQVQRFGNPRMEALKIIQKGLEQVLSGIDVLIGIEEEEEKKEDRG